MAKSTKPEQILAAWQALPPEQKARYRHAHEVLDRFKRLQWRREVQGAFAKERRALDELHGAASRAIEQGVRRALGKVAPSPAPESISGKDWLESVGFVHFPKRSDESIKAWSRRLSDEARASAPITPGYVENYIHTHPNKAALVKR
jgi:hypothetical protein